jgi:putative transposase
MRKIQIAKNEHYHLYSRGVGKQILFKDTRDYARMLFLILYLQSPVRFLNTKRHSDTYSKNETFAVDEKTIAEISQKREVEVVNFCIMPNHFHITVLNAEEGGIPRYMQRVQLAYAKYFNAKYKQSGHVFQGSYGATLVETNEQLLYLSAYIHKNPSELPLWRKKLDTYPWSSLTDYTHENRWGALLVPDLVLEQFKTKKEYAHFIKTSSAKENEYSNFDVLN